METRLATKPTATVVSSWTQVVETSLTIDCRTIGQRLCGTVAVGVRGRLSSIIQRWSCFTFPCRCPFVACPSTCRLSATCVTRWCNQLACQCSCRSPSHLFHKHISLAADSQAQLAAVFRLLATPQPQSPIVSLACRMIWLTWIQYSCSCSSRASLNVSFYGKTID